MRLTRVEFNAGGRVKLHFEDGSVLKTFDHVAAQYQMLQEREITEQEFADLKKAAAAADAKDKAVRIVAATNVSEKDLKQRLIHKGQTEEDAHDAVEWLKELQLLDDERTASLLVSAAVRKGYGASRIKSILYEKGIPRELWEQALQEVPVMDDAIDRFLIQRLQGRPADQKMIKKAVDALLRRGHSWSDIQQGLKRVQSELEYEAEYLEELS